jgi:hypothetical protein
MQFSDVCVQLFSLIFLLKNKSRLYEACKEYDILYNLAAEHKDNITPLSLYEEVNVGGARNVCDVAEKAGIKKFCENTLNSSNKMLTSGFKPLFTIEKGHEKTIKTEFLIN